MAGFDWFWNALGASKGRNQKQSLKTVEAAGDLTAQLTGLCDAELAAYGREHVDSPAEFLACLAVASERTLGLTPFPVQAQGTLRLLDGDVIHMATGEGKTLVGAMAATGFALRGKSVHMITVNDYLAARDAEWMRPLVEFFGLSVGAIGEQVPQAERRAIYQRDVVYGPVNELGFDVLRDQLITRRADAVQHGADVAIVDEADSVLVDEALVPLVLAGSVPGTAPQGRITQIVKNLTAGEDYTVSSDGRTAFLTDAGATKVEVALGISSLYDEEHVGTTLVQVNLALHAQALLQRDVHYIVREGKVELIDASKGRVAQLQRWPDGIQAAVEAKEGLAVSEGGRILDSMTIQALMGRYPLVCGMTGTAVEATDQLREFYNLRVSVIEPNRPLIRIDEADRIYATAEEKTAAIVEEILGRHETGQPILVGTEDVAESEELASQLREAGVEVNVLNAKNDAEEAQIIAEAGDVGRITVSTQMAGRGTDIKLGGTDESDRERVVEAGGLCVIGSNRHKTARLDNQLRGRSGRQGDPGYAVLFVSLDDDLVVSGGAGEQVTAHPDGTGLITEKKVHEFVDHCQRVTEGQLLEIHSQTWKYSKLLADQREIIDARRAKLLDTEQALDEFTERAPQRVAELADLDHAVLVQAAREVMLYHLDDGWASHLAVMDEVRESIHLRAIARETPLTEFHRIAVREFKELVNAAVAAAVETFERIRIDGDGAHLDEEGLVRPSATWTYMVGDNPLQKSGSSLLRGIGDIFR
ncbi:MAG: accessory Sec system translocase SecA2 [Corynebacterium sp.]|nr:accessory Sec system translocase SecA2 [Corynebacterium sp.]